MWFAIRRIGPLNSTKLWHFLTRTLFFAIILFTTLVFLLSSFFRLLCHSQHIVWNRNGYDFKLKCWMLTLSPFARIFFFFALLKSSVCFYFWVGTISTLRIQTSGDSTLFLLDFLHVFFSDAVRANKANCYFNVMYGAKSACGQSLNR